MLTTTSALLFPSVAFRDCLAAYILSLVARPVACAAACAVSMTANGFSRRRTEVVVDEVESEKAPLRATSPQRARRGRDG